VTEYSRRRWLKRSLSMTGATVGLPLLGQERASSGVNPAKKLRVIVAGGHPDDPESGCGGTMARYADLGHDVVALYLTRGEAGIAGKTHEEAAAIRTREAERACEILKARPLWAGQINGDTQINHERYDAFRVLLEAEKPDLVFTHWPIDTHPDHRAISLLTYDAWLRLQKAFALYYFEVMTGAQTQLFSPSVYVDISATEARKRASCYAHVSQNPDEFYGYHDAMNRFRGMEAGVKVAEAFARHGQSEIENLPG
jgi:N-acetylglucosamine malate deacetylase 1